MDNWQYHERMRSISRLPAQAGTSVIAAIVVAAILGGIALGLHLVESNSANTAALSAQTAPAAEATAQSDETCVDGEDFNYTVTAQTSSSFFSSNTQTQQSASAPKIVATCPSDQTILGYEEGSAGSGAYMSNGTPQNLPPEVTIWPGQTIQVNGKSYTAATTRNAMECQAGQPNPQKITSPICVYKLNSSKNGYTLQNWSCRVTSSNATPDSNLCWVKDVPVQGGVNSVSPTTPSAGSGTTGTASVSDNGSLATQGCTSKGNVNGTVTYTCDNLADAQSQADTLNRGGLTCDLDASQNAVNCTNTTTPATGPNSPTTGNSMATAGCTAGAPANGSTSYYCDTTQNAQNQLNQLQSNGATKCAIGSDGYYVTCSTANTTTIPPQGPCQTGTMTATGCSTPTPAPVPPPTTQTPTQSQSSGNILSSLLSGLAKGLLSPCSNTQSQSIGGNGTTLVPQTILQPNGTYTTVYVQQSTGVNSSGSPCAPAQQQAPYGVGSNGAACSVPPAQPQCATGATPMPISASGNGCVTSYQCVPINGSTISTTPTPQISCSPQIADVGESVAISYSCQNATGSSGGGFSTNNQLSGSASSTITAPPSGTNTANFGLTCTNSGQTASAQCSVQVNQPAIDLVADPQAVPSGQISSIGWVTAGMQSCVISSADDATFTSANASNTSVSGVAQTDAITGPTHFTLTCQTFGGQTKTATTEVTVGSATSTAAAGENITVNSNVDGQSSNHGGTIAINWQSTSAPSGSVVSLWLIDVGTEQATALIAGAQTVNGSYQWQLPAAGASCDPNSIAPCASDLVAGDSYGIEAALYTPANAYLGGSPQPANAVNPSYSDYSYTPTPFMLGQ